MGIYRDADYFWRLPDIKKKKQPKKHIKHVGLAAVLLACNQQNIHK